MKDRQQMDKQGKGMASKKLQEEAEQADNQVKRRDCGICRCRMEQYINIGQRKVEGSGKGFCLAAD